LKRGNRGTGGEKVQNPEGEKNGGDGRGRPCNACRIRTRGALRSSEKSGKRKAADGRKEEPLDYKGKESTKQNLGKGEGDQEEGFEGISKTMQPGTIVKKKKAGIPAGGDREKEKKTKVRLKSRTGITGSS